MPRYFFHVVNDEFRTDDETGSEFADLAAARHNARAAAGQILAEELLAGTILIHLTVIIDDEHGNRVATLKFVTTMVSIDGPLAP